MQPRWIPLSFCSHPYVMFRQMHEAADGAEFAIRSQPIRIASSLSLSPAASIKPSSAP